MLFAYQYVSHPLENLHRWMEHLVLQVWCRNGGAYSVSRLCPELQAIAEEIDAVDTIKHSIFDDIRDIDGLIQGLTQAKRDELATMFRESTAVDDLCKGNPPRRPYNYKDLELWDEQIAEKLKEFFYSLFDKHIKSGPICKELGNLKNHVDLFCGTNKEGLCPFCGIEDNKDENNSVRDPYDHYLPRSKYPFNSVNFRNLAPMCDTCNSKYKTTKDPISRTTGTRQKAFAPFEPTVHFPDIRIKLDTSKLQTLEPADIQITIQSATHQQELDTWSWLFGIDERYKGKLCKKRGALTWLKTVLDDSKAYGISPLEVLDNIRKNTDADPFLDDGFLKRAVLDHCDQAGLFNVAP